ncbi:NAD-dependent epimerase/dehydratase family protein [Atopomonas sediminilitoris]|uniref:NAD-dependent epimerase/dehydratase family protein n=1 Tax=Atopomonas sediminilitoris TaxID=2919919 RepID=UPI001F4D8111|nr:NAD-dependent epimerase/dehydratase family protein [Atopomonas sediminilitoris]MCJ8168705.1 NAD-dependent epimerase/dehydratase family protein [Atopomonas sediminilitoris]
MHILVTGAGGFIGGRFALFALQQGLQVRVNARRADSVAALLARGAELCEGDLADPQVARVACRGVDAVVHCAGAVGVWGPRERFVAGNITLTEQVVDACLKENVSRLVHLSSPSIYFGGANRVGITEEDIPTRFADYYGETKYQAEQAVFAAAEFGLEVLALRPRFVTGAGDTSIFPRLINMQQKGRLRVVGDGLNRVDFTSIGNLCDALFSALQVGGAALGKAYNISNGQPVPFWDVVNYVLRRMELGAVRGRLPYSLAWSVAALNEGVCHLLPNKPEPSLFRLGIDVMAKDFSLDISRAQTLLDYRAECSLWDALDEFCDDWQAAHA